MSKGNGRRGGELASASLSAILRGGRDDGPQRRRVPPRRPPTPFRSERRHHRRTRCRSNITNGVGPCCRGRQDYGRNVFYSVSRLWVIQFVVFGLQPPIHRSHLRGPGVRDRRRSNSRMCRLRISRREERPSQSKQHTRQDSQRQPSRARCHQFDPLHMVTDALVQPFSPMGPGICHATHRIVRAHTQFQTLRLAATCLTPTAMRMAI